MPLHVIDNHVRSLVEHLHPITVVSMKTLLRLVHGKSDIATGGMPGGIDQRRERLIGLGVQFLYLISLDQIGARMFITHVEQETIGILHTEGVAIHAILVAVFILHDRCLRIAR